MKALVIVSAFLFSSVALSGTIHVQRIQYQGHFMPVTALCYDASIDSFKSTIPAFKCGEVNHEGDCITYVPFTLVIPRVKRERTKIGVSSSGDAIYGWQETALPMDYTLSIYEDRKGSEFKIGEQPYTIPACAK